MVSVGQADGTEMTMKFQVSDLQGSQFLYDTYETLLPVRVNRAKGMHALYDLCPTNHI